MKIVEANPDGVFQLTGLLSPGKSTLRSVTLKVLERMADGVIVPESTVPPLTVIEFQFFFFIGFCTIFLTLPLVILAGFQRKYVNVRQMSASILVFRPGQGWRFGFRPVLPIISRC